MIPKKIHYVWVGDQPKPELVLKCIQSWKEQLPDYEIIEWGNDAVSLIDNQYIHEAFANKKWAFVSDVIRLYALYEYGGIYLDTDVEVRASFDEFLKHDFFTGHEIHNGIYAPIVTAVMGARPGSKIIGDLLNIYHDRTFIINDQFDMQPNTVKVTKYFEKEFNIHPPYKGEEAITLMDNCVVYPYYFFCTPKPNHPNYSIHLFDGSWIPGFARRDKISLFKFTLARFKKVANNEVLDLGIKDTVIFSINISKQIKYAIILKG